MKVNKKSWHYRLLYFFNGKREWKMPKNLCGYFWTVVFTIFVSIPLILLTSPLWIPLLGLFILGEKIDKWHRRRKGKKEDWRLRHTEKEPGIFRSYYRATKDKVCPLIEYTE